MVCAILAGCYLLALVTSSFCLTYGHKPIGIESRSLEAIYQAALKEKGTLKISWGGDARSASTGLIAAFTKRFPDVKFNLTVDLSKYHDSRADRTFDTSNGEDDGADVIVIQTVHDFPRWKEANRLLPYKVATWNDIQSPFKDEDGTFTGCFIYEFGIIVFNDNKVANDTVPTSYKAFLKPEWRNKLALTYPNDDDAILYLFTSIVKRHGWTFIDSLVSQNVTWLRGSGTPSELIAKPPSQNELTASFAASTRVAAVVSTKLPTEDHYVTWPQTGAIFATTTMPETAKLFMSYIMSDEWQAIASASSGYATRKEFDKNEVLNQTLTNPLGFVTFMQDRANVERWRFQFETTLGTPQGVSPLLNKTVI
ncbi:uncharacterized protein LACBIDRAFT_190104 [Laccaria bicolor S238N-H82]|uniref:Predicted protein n=1 Tax=Laccaria bicolor (strain S238N-H82 / ATCC MYA-4686) TaxID=486041 RepID=B0D7B7_LACBS|nr:uncharacterized protein LACBIDRAFT_190104 [Laccaria bicolor S238N-H82]EDR09625.1 predicted protein [Laccaria bicolor S238N-H82]|eukprot:XP_001879974.1 predicted protein [Laccaria bicolor S238N-H82]